MKVEDAIKLLKETNENKFLEIIIPSTSEQVNFKELSTKHYQDISKVGFLDNDKLPEKIDETISELGNMDATGLTEYNKLCILMLLKSNNSINKPLKYNIVCKNEKCREILTDDFDLNGIYKDRIFGDNSYELKDGDIDIKIELGESTVKENSDFEVYNNSQKDSLDQEDDKKLYDLYVNTYERYMLYIDTIIINGTPVEDYKSMGISERIKFLSNFTHNIIDVDKIENYIKDSYDNLVTVVKCKSCGSDNKNIMHHNDFLLI